MRALYLVALSIALASCASGPTTTWDRLADDEAVWSRCQRVIADHLCGTLANTTNPHLRSACVIQLMNEFQAQAGYQLRRGWLISNGCPGPLVSPEQITIDQQEAAAAPVARLPDGGVVFTP